MAPIATEDFVKNNNEQEQSYVDQYNREAYARYVRTIDNINASLDAGRSAPMAAPQVPTGMVLSPPDPNTKLQFAIFSPIPLGPAIPLHPDTTHANDPTPPNQIHIGMPEVDAPGWYTAGPGDSIKSGREVFGVAANGDRGMFEKFGGIGTTGWYLKVS